jgi:hypothetical protein
MEEQYLYHYKINRKQRSKIFIRMARACMVYILALHGYEAYTGDRVDEDTRTIFIYAFLFSAAVLSYIAWWHIRNPATYEATVTAQRFTVTYPGSDQWSFDVSISDIEKFEHRRSHLRSTIIDSGMVMKDGTFYHIPMNYGNNLKKMHAAVKGVNPNVSFSKLVNKRIH